MSINEVFEILKRNFHTDRNSPGRLYAVCSLTKDYYRYYLAEKAEGMSDTLHIRTQYKVARMDWREAAKANYLEDNSGFEAGLNSLLSLDWDTQLDIK